MTNLKRFWMLLFVTLTVFPLVTAAVTVHDLTCEYKTNPLGIDILQPRFGWQIEAGKRDVMQSAWEIRAANNLKDLVRGKNLIWASGKINSDASAHVIWQGPALQAAERVYWQVRVWDNADKRSAWSDPAWFEMGLLSPADWKALWIRGDISEDSTLSNPAQYYRNDFMVTKTIKSARAYVTSLGLYALHINGKRVGNQYFTPGWTSYNNRLQYQVYDITSLLVKGENAVGAIVGDGWYRGHIGWNGSLNKYGKKLGLLVQLVITFEDGTVQIIGTQKNWKATTGPILMSDIYNGETYDARLEMDHWDRPDFDDGNWKKVSIFSRDNGTLIASEASPVRKQERITPVKILVTPEGDTVADMGQNMVGWVQLRVNGPRGKVVTLRHAEVLDKQGNFYTENLRAAKATVSYTLRGGGEETFEPHFTYQGFRYVAVSGFPGKLKPENITGIVLHSDFNMTGSFSCSDTLINKLQHNIQWGMKGNFLEVPTDCPQRDERLGWTGDAQVFAPTACFNGDVAAFYSRWVKDFTADQQAEGEIPHVIPDVLSITRGHKGSSASAGWADAAVIVPWTVYQAYGDTRILRQQYPCMKRWVSYEEKRAGESHFWKQDFTFGDWLAYNTTSSDYPGATTDKDFITEVYFARSVGLMAKIAGILGYKGDEKHYKELLGEIKEVFQREFLTPAGRLSPNTQTAYALALYIDLIPQDLKAVAAKRLAEDVKHFGHLTTGFLGTPLLCPVLSANGYTDVAYMLLNRKEYPSWLYPVTRGATTIWERWDGIKPDSTFQDPGMNSFNHYAYGAIGYWMYGTVAGINLDEKKPGYKHIVFAPQPGGGISHASAYTQSVYGKIAIAWKKENGRMEVKVTIPVNTYATVILPEANTNQLEEHGKPVSTDPTFKALKQEGENVILETGSGSYFFTYPVNKD